MLRREEEFRDGGQTNQEAVRDEAQRGSLGGPADNVRVSSPAGRPQDGTHFNDGTLRDPLCITVCSLLLHARVGRVVPSHWTG